MQYSVLMSVYEKEQPLFFRESRQSILRQSMPPAQIVVVCDGRLTDELYEVLAEVQVDNPALFTIVQLENRSGLGMALNQGMQHCRYEIIARMDSDDISLPDRMKWQIEAMEAHEADLISGPVAEFETNPSIPGKIRKLPVTQEEILRLHGVGIRLIILVSCIKKARCLQQAAISRLRDLKIIISGSGCSETEQRDIIWIG